jgi:hypothetical protein
MGTNYEYNFFFFILLLHSFCDFQGFQHYAHFPSVCVRDKVSHQEKQTKSDSSCCLQSVGELKDTGWSGWKHSADVLIFVFLMSSACCFVFRERYIRCVGQWEEA